MKSDTENALTPDPGVLRLVYARHLTGLASRVADLYRHLSLSRHVALESIDALDGIKAQQTQIDELVDKLNL